MTDHADPEPAAQPEAKPPRRTIVRAVLLAVGSTVALVTIYYLLPLDRSSTWVAVTMLVIGAGIAHWYCSSDSRSRSSWARSSKAASSS